MTGPGFCKSLTSPPALLAVAVIIAVAVRIPWLLQPFTDAWAWRQSDTAMVARNFFQNGFNFFFPQIDWAGPAPGYIGTEFPLVPYVTAIGYALLGEREWIGRTVSLLFHLASLPFFYRLCRDSWNACAARFTTVFYLFMPLTLVASVSLTSDMAACSLAVMGLERFAHWTRTPESRRAYWAAMLATTLALLTKVSYLPFALPILYLAWERWGPGLFREIRLWVFTAVTLLATAAWYLHAYAIKLTYFPHYMFGDGMLRIVEWSVYRDIALQTFLWGSAQTSNAYSAVTPVLTVAMVAGLFLRPNGRQGYVFHWLMLAMLVFNFAAGMGSRFPAYQLPIGLVTAALAGRSCDAVLRFTRERGTPDLARHGAIALFVGAFLATAAMFAVPSYYPWAKPYRSAGTVIDATTPVDSLIVVAADLEPTTLYYSRRKGWSFDTEPVSFVPARGEAAVSALEIYRQLGAGYFVIPVFHRDVLDDAVFRDHLTSRYPLLRQTDEFAIYGLANPRNPSASR